MLDYKLLRALAMVCQEGGFDKAAKRLHLTQSAISQRIRQLEDQLGSPLIIRGNPPQPTAMGQRLLAHYQQVAQLESDLRGEISLPRQGEFLPLPIGINEDSLATWFIDAVAPLALSRNFTLRLSVDDQDETHRLLRDGLVLGCVSTRSEPLQGCSAVYLGSMDYRCVASPAFAAEWFPDGLRSEAIAKAPAVIYNEKDRLHYRFLEEQLGITHHDFPHHYIPSTHAFLGAIAAGLGYGLVPQPQVAPLLAGAAALDLRPEAKSPVHLYWHHWDLKTGAIKELTETLVNFARGRFGK
ncbi:LysR family transcriptional regulator [Desulfuromonas versatilis]|uniref:LysR family transcriptional regulator n=1 Tax=Desulfuromonas versatilis TaxID=2802975 RepID=A0ABN6DW22_9BACT|nr:LysR family transcriptional regulator ArgP [Desulfuromonas versatilis]BCR04321.1 LysR family transcriptional regulator [Desulfuromonas versatilis]